MPLREGEIVEGKVVKTGKSAIFLDLGSKGTGIIFGREFDDAREAIKELKPGEKTSAKVIDVDNEQGYVELSLARAHKELVWQELQKRKDKGENIKVKIIGANKGGLLSKVSGISAFLPVSQLSQEHYPQVPGAESSKILQALQEFIGQELEVKIFNISPKQEKLILSEKAKEIEKKKLALQDYNVGDIVKGKITGITSFGAFMEFSLPNEIQEAETGDQAGGEMLMEGLVHISEIDSSETKDALGELKQGQEIKAKIIEISDGKVALSIKALNSQKTPKSK